MGPLQDDINAYYDSFVTFQCDSYGSTHPEEVSVPIVIQPVMNHYVPGTIVVGKGRGVPPVLENEKINHWVNVWIQCNHFQFQGSKNKNAGLTPVKLFTKKTSESQTM